MTNFSKNKKYFAVALLLVILVVPTFASASWWNPFSWNIWQKIAEIFYKPQVVQVEQEKKTEDKELVDETADLALSEVEGWKTYTNTEYGFEIKYPENMSFEDISREKYMEDIWGKILVSMSGHNTIDMENSLSVTFHITLPPIERCTDFENYKYNSVSKLLINNAQFYKQTSKQLDKSGAGADEYANYYTIKNNKCFRLSFVFGYYPQSFSKDIIDQQKKISELIISTFKFIK